MPYYGQRYTVQDLSFVQYVDFGEIIYLSGSFPNPFGHLVLNINDHYFHVIGKYTFILNKSEWKYYLKENNKRIISVQKFKIKDGRLLYSKLIKAMNREFKFNLLFNNCFLFVQEVINSDLDIAPPENKIIALGNTLDHIFVRFGISRIKP